MATASTRLRKVLYTSPLGDLALDLGLQPERLTLLAAGDADTGKDRPRIVVSGGHPCSGEAFRQLRCREEVRYRPFFGVVPADGSGRVVDLLVALAKEDEPSAIESLCALCCTGGVMVPPELIRFVFFQGHSANADAVVRKGLRRCGRRPRPDLT